MTRSNTRPYTGAGPYTKELAGLLVEADSIVQFLSDQHIDGESNGTTMLQTDGLMNGKTMISLANAIEKLAIANVSSAPQPSARVISATDPVHLAAKAFLCGSQLRMYGGYLDRKGDPELIFPDELTDLTSRSSPPYFHQPGKIGKKIAQAYQYMVRKAESILDNFLPI